MYILKMKDKHIDINKDLIFKSNSLIELFYSVGKYFIELCDYKDFEKSYIKTSGKVSFLDYNILVSDYKKSNDDNYENSDFKDILKLSVVLIEPCYDRILRGFKLSAEDEYLVILKRYLYSYLGYGENQYYLSKIGCKSEEI